jgi:diguanylate cyclase (GGDEF)-like protein
MWTTITAGGRWRGEIKNRTADGGLIWEQVSISPVLDASGGIVNFVALMEDITEKRQAEETIRRLALHDTLTGLPNRYRFQEELAGALARNKRRGTRLGLVFLDLDGFKAINDNLGHEAGDEVLVEVAARLGRCVREGDIVARLGGDEFTVILDDMEHPEKAGEVADRILESLARPFDLDGRSRHVGASMGIAVAPDHAETSRELIRLADAAMYRVKESGKNGWALHEQPA